MEKNERIGQMRHRVELVKPEFTRDDYGAQVKHWVGAGYKWAQIEFKEGASDEKNDVNRLTSIVAIRVRLRFDALIQPTWRLVHYGKSYDVLTVLPDAMRHYMILECEHDVQKDYTVQDDAGNLPNDPAGNIVTSR